MKRYYANTHSKSGSREHNRRQDKLGLSTSQVVGHWPQILHRVPLSMSAREKGLIRR